jgi:hypothetical protein
VAGLFTNLNKMNLIDVSITKIIEEPKQVVTDDFCGWVVKVMTNCYGAEREKIFTAVTKKEIEKYKVGFTWME